MNNSLGGVSNVSGGPLGSLEAKNTVSHTSVSSLVTIKKATPPVTADTVPQAVSVDHTQLARLEALRGQVQSGNYVVDIKATAARWLATSAEMVAHKVK